MQGRESRWGEGEVPFRARGFQEETQRGDRAGWRKPLMPIWKSAEILTVGSMNATSFNVNSDINLPFQVSSFFSSLLYWKHLQVSFEN